ncbi:MAG: hypothetical protein F6K31_13255 [Symploca sp. SIO2G7]|nr:hypothetical protein [Symploca sp. SIO2G7]
MPNKKTDKANDVFIRVFLSSDLRTQFKVACAQSGVAMSEKARELIDKWVKEWEQQNTLSSTKGKEGKE